MLSLSRYQQSRAVDYFTRHGRALSTTSVPLIGAVLHAKTAWAFLTHARERSLTATACSIHVCTQSLWSCASHARVTCPSDRAVESTQSL